MSPLIWDPMAPGMRLLCPDLYPMGIPACQHFILALFPSGKLHRGLSSTEPPDRGEAQDRVFISSPASSALQPQPCPALPSKECPKPKGTGWQRCLLSLSPDVATGSEHLSLLQHKRLSNSISSRIFFPLLAPLPPMSSSRVLCPARLPQQSPASLAGSPSLGELLRLRKRWERMIKAHGLLLSPFCFLSLSSQHLNAFESILQSKGGKGPFVCLLLKHLTSN